MQSGILRQAQRKWEAARVLTRNATMHISDVSYSLIRINVDIIHDWLVCAMDIAHLPFLPNPVQVDKWMISISVANRVVQVKTIK